MPPVPAGISRPTMTFSLRPSSVSDLPLTAASVSTRVVSWNEAAEMNERVCSEALVMPSSTGLADAGRLPAFSACGIHLLELDPVELLALDEVRLARIRDLDLLQHLPNDDLDVLVIDGHALQPVDVLDLVDEIVGELLDALDGQDVVRCGMAVVDEVAALDAVAMSGRRGSCHAGSGTRPAPGVSSSGLMWMRCLFL